MQQQVPPQQTNEQGRPNQKEPGAGQGQAGAEAAAPGGQNPTERGAAPAQGGKSGAAQDGKSAPAKAGQPGPGQPPAGKGGPNPNQPPELPRGNTDSLNDAYAFLQEYVAKEMQGIPTDLSQVQMPAESGSPLQDLGGILPKTSTGALKTAPNFSPSIGSTPSPNLPTGQFPSGGRQQQLVGGIPASQVRLQQMKLPERDKA